MLTTGGLGVAVGARAVAGIGVGQEPEPEPRLGQGLDEAVAGTTEMGTEVQASHGYSVFKENRTHRSSRAKIL